MISHRSCRLDHAYAWLVNVVWVPTVWVPTGRACHQQVRALDNEKWIALEQKDVHQPKVRDGAVVVI